MAVTAALLTLSVCAVLWRGRSLQPSDPAKAVPRPTTTVPGMPSADGAPDIPAYAPPEPALLTAQLEVGQTFHVQTRNSLYVLTLRDPVLGLYDAIRTGPKRDGSVVEERFQMVFAGTFVPYQGLLFGAFVLGGNLSYRKMRGKGVESVTPSSPVVRILFSIPMSYRQAS